MSEFNIFRTIIIFNQIGSKKASLHFPFTHAFSALCCIFNEHTLFVVSSLKMQDNAENACVNDKWQLLLIPDIIV